MSTRNYYDHPHRGITVASTTSYVGSDGALFAVVDLGHAGQLWIRDKETARDVLKAVAEALKILDPPAHALTDQTTPYWPAYLKVVPLNASVQPAFCADCGAPEGLVPLVCEGGVCRCWDGERCDERQARAAGYGLNGSTP